MTPRQRLLAAIKGDPAMVDRLLVVAEPAGGLVVRCERDAYRAIAPLCAGRSVEVFCAVALDRRHRVIGSAVLTRGSDAYCLVDPKQVFRWALLQGRSGACAVILGHNHPSGDPTPSSQDYEVTRRCSRAGAVLGISVLDHVVTGDGDRFSSIAALGGLS